MEPPDQETPKFPLQQARCQSSGELKIRQAIENIMPSPEDHSKGELVLNQDGEN